MEGGDTDGVSLALLQQKFDSFFQHIFSDTFRHAIPTRNTISFSFWCWYVTERPCYLVYLIDRTNDGIWIGRRQYSPYNVEYSIELIQLKRRFTFNWSNER